ncbi:ATP-binding protein [Flavobacterium sp.]|uniref:ATP-binding protein n=1 Tax=Flavobacterium sp. TaxID=239 RepID=UPI0039E645A7
MEYKISAKDLAQSHRKTVSACKALVDQYKAHPDTKIILDFGDCDFIYPDYALLFLCTIKYLEKLGFTVGGEILANQKSVPVKYLASMNFFENLKVQLPFHVDQADEKNSVLIQKYTKETQLDVLKNILNVLKEKSSMDDNVFTGLDYCFNEILDNVLNHSAEKEGWVAAQYFESINSVRLIISDSGIGIHQSLNEKHNFSEEEAMLKCIEEGVTNGKGQGHGLYATSTFVKLNKGWLTIISGNKSLNVSEKETVVKDIDYWPGTSVYVRINTNVTVDYTEFTSRNYDYKKQLFEDMFEAGARE